VEEYKQQRLLFSLCTAYDYGTVNIVICCVKTKAACGV